MDFYKKMQICKKNNADSMHIFHHLRARIGYFVFRLWAKKDAISPYKSDILQKHSDMLQ